MSGGSTRAAALPVNVWREHLGRCLTCQCLAGALGPPLAFLEEGVEARAALVALLNLVLGPLKEVDKGRVGLEQVPRVLEQNVAHTNILRPVQLRFSAQAQGVL